MGGIVASASGERDANVRFLFPRGFDPDAARDTASLAGSSSASYSIQAQGMGQAVGLSYSVSAHTVAKIKANLGISAMTSADVRDLNELALGMLNASAREEIRDYERASASADLSIWSWALGGGGASASYEQTHESMRSKGLTEDQITMLMQTFLERASKMSTVELDFTVNNTNNDYAVEGNFFMYTVVGEVTSGSETKQYRLLADQGSAGGPPPTGGGAPAAGNYLAIN